MCEICTNSIAINSAYDPTIIEEDVPFVRTKFYKGEKELSIFYVYGLYRMDKEKGVLCA